VEKKRKQEKRRSKKKEIKKTISYININEDKNILFKKKKFKKLLYSFIISCTAKILPGDLF